jgi:glycosyltransferase involved in cell wall biosynthesis
MADAADRPHPPAAPYVVYLASQGAGIAWVPEQVAALRAAGLSVELHALRAPDGLFHQSAEVAALEAATRYVYPLRAGAFLASLIAAPLRLRGRLARALLRAAWTAPRESPAARLRALAHLAVAIHWVSTLRAGVAHVHADMAHAPATLALYAGELLGVPFSFTGHANDLFQRRVALRDKLARAAFVACISSFHRDLYLREGAAPERLPIVHLGIELERFRLRPPPPDPAEPLLLSAGRLVEKKGFDVFAEACAELWRRGLRFRAAVAGSGPLLDRLREQARALGLDGVLTYTGCTIAQEELPGFLSGGTVFCLACKPAADGDVDGLPVVLMEAMACGVPVVSTRLAGIPDLVADEETGLLAPPGDPIALADAIERLLGDPLLRRRLVEQGRRRVEEEFELRGANRRLAEWIRRSALPRPELACAS